MGPTWLGNQFLKELIIKPKLKCKEMQVIIQSRFNYNVSWSKCYKAKCRVVSLIEGRLGDHYAKLWDYGGELLRSNPGQCKGELLTAIRRDANNQVYPIAWAVVDIENKLKWKWLLELITNDLELDGGRGMAVISDQHKGLLKATKEVLPLAQHRQCASHIYMPTSGRTFQCTNCQQKGHNKVYCENPKVIPEPNSKKKMGRHKLDPNLTHWRRGGRGGRGGRGCGRGSRGEMGESINGPQFEVKTEYEVKLMLRLNLSMRLNLMLRLNLSMRLNLMLSDAEIMSTLGINESQLKEFGSINVEEEVNEEVVNVQEKEVNVQEEEINVQEEIQNDEDIQEIAKRNTQERRMRNTQRIRRRKPSKRIIELKLKKQVVSKFGMIESKALNLE
ncbi:unnamed protein product [Lactuca saligna]|uniref:MULE transposase domain-containing protein n=1 Tax=Lactuca saligna TaxID=75948 RepID=A0AA36DVA3_LACSI|nr:unnamed protein product [Lactuca saligna]